MLTLCGLAPDVDGLGLVIDQVNSLLGNTTTYWSQYHHALHSLVMSLVVSAIAFSLARSRRLLMSAGAFLLFHLHLLCDLMGSKGPDNYPWPIPYFSPLTNSEGFTVDWQWPLNGWQNIGLTLLLVVITYRLIRFHATSPFELVSERLNRTLVTLIR